METSHFLPEKYADLAGSKQVERAVKKKIRQGDKGPATKEGRVEAYMDRLEQVTAKKERKSASGRELDGNKGFDLLKHKILDRFTMNIGDEETLTKIAEGLYESEKRLAIEQGRGGDIQKLESTQDIIEHYKPLIREKAEIQRKTLSFWLDYLQQNDAKQPMDFRYFVVRSLEKMGMLDKEKLTYSKRASTTVAPFPELNSEALGWVYKRLSEGLEPEYLVAQDEETQKKKETILSLIKSKDFAKLYAFALVETAGKLNRESVEGQWKKYNQNSDFAILENNLKGKGTGWCTAEGSAQAQLQGGDFYVYYTKSNSGYTEPRIAIRMEGESVAEVRGVNQRQELEPNLIDVAQNKYHNLPGGESYDKKASDMREVTRLTKKQEQNQPFTKDELVFLYEINTQIEGFGYEKDPRVAELRAKRNTEADMLIVFECQPEQIAHSPNHITKDTKAYVGKLEPGIFAKLSEDVEHVYTSFPEGKIRRLDIEIGGKTAEQLETQLREKNVNISNYAQDMLHSPYFKPSKNPETATLIRLKVGDLFSDDRNHTTEQIFQRAEEIGLEFCPPDAGPNYRLQYMNQLMGEWLYIGMKPIADRSGDPFVFSLARDASGLWLYDRWG